MQDDVSPPDPMPPVISPMLAVLTDRAFSDPQWLFEPKWDGYRAITFIDKDSLRFVSRKNEDLARLFGHAQEIPGVVNAETAILDGELIALDSSGRSSFQLLQNAARNPHGIRMIYYAFDLLYLNGRDLRKRPLIERKDLLQSVIRETDFLKYCDHVVEKGEHLYEEARKSGLEGIVAKQMQSPYVEKRTKYWLKIKTVQRQEVVIGGYTCPRRSRQYFGALVVGVYDSGLLVFAGQVGTGFDEATLREVYNLMQPLRVDHCAFAVEPKTNEPAVWVKPELVCEVKFHEWTDEGILRQPVFLGIRRDKPPGDVVRELPKSVETLAEAPKSKPGRRHVTNADELFEQGQLKGDVCASVDGIEVSLSNLNKVYWPDEGYTKGDLLRYYYRIRQTILPHLAGRPQILRRFPDGIKGESFYQHNLDEVPDFVERATITEGGDVVNYALINNAASLLYIVNLGCIAQNPFSSRAADPESPDWFVLDLDPEEEATFDTVCTVAAIVNGVLDELGLVGYPKTSGARGMHVYVPIEPIYTYEQAQGFGRCVASIVASRAPDIATLDRLKKMRSHAQVYVDFLQTAFGKSMASPYSVRAVPGATVSTPLTWAEVEPKADRAQFTMLTVPQRIATVGDLFGEVLTRPQRLTQPLQRLEKLLAKVKKGGRS